MTGKKFSCLALGLGWLAGCHTPVVVPPRPASVPAEAVWAGGADGGAWIGCALPLGRATNTCTVWDDDGRHWLTAKFERRRVVRDAAAVTALGFNGRRIGLSDGSVLEPTERIRGEE